MIFRRTTLRLTIAYSLVQLLVLGAFAIAVWAFVTSTFDFDAAEQQGDGAVTGAEQGFATLRVGLLTGYAALVVVVPIVSYLMARLAMRPVRAGFERQQSFVDGASHEMRTPLSILRGELELALARPRTADAYRESIGVALASAERLIAFTGDLLLLSRQDTKELAETFTDLDLADLIVEAAWKVESVTPGGPVITAEPEGGLNVRGSAPLLARALENLISNAVKYTPSDGRVQVTCDQRGALLSIQVTDTGSGMSELEIRRAFDRFWRSERVADTAGSGLGLAIVREIVTAHRGTVHITSQVGAGTTVTVLLPVATN